MSAAHKAELVAWYITTFVPDPERGHARMTPIGARHKYTRKPTLPVTPDLIRTCFDGGTRRLNIKGQWISVPMSIAVVPTHRNGTARAAILDVDTGGREAVQIILAMCQSIGLWAFAQLSTSIKSDDHEPHDGGHVYIPTTEPMPASLLRDLAERITHTAGIEAETYPQPDQDLRLPLMPHLRAPSGPTFYPLLLQSGRLIDAGDPWKALEELRYEYA